MKGRREKSEMRSAGRKVKRLAWNNTKYRTHKRQSAESTFRSNPFNLSCIQSYSDLEEEEYCVCNTCLLIAAALVADAIRRTSHSPIAL
eukprot:767641-Hanusia_phi.AAC.2